MNNTSISVLCSQETASQIRADADEIGLSVEEFLKALHRIWWAYRQEAEQMKGGQVDDKLYRAEIELRDALEEARIMGDRREWDASDRADKRVTLARIDLMVKRLHFKGERWSAGELNRWEILVDELRGWLE